MSVTSATFALVVMVVATAVCLSVSISFVWGEREMEESVKEKERVEKIWMCWWRADPI